LIVGDYSTQWTRIARSQVLEVASRDLEAGYVIISAETQHAVFKPA